MRSLPACSHFNQYREFGFVRGEGRTFPRSSGHESISTFLSCSEMVIRWERCRRYLLQLFQIVVEKRSGRRLDVGISTVRWTMSIQGGINLVTKLWPRFASTGQGGSEQGLRSRARTSATALGCSKATHAHTRPPPRPAPPLRYCALTIRVSYLPEEEIRLQISKRSVTEFRITERWQMSGKVLFPSQSRVGGRENGKHAASVTEAGVSEVSSGMLISIMWLNLEWFRHTHRHHLSFCQLELVLLEPLEPEQCYHCKWPRATTPSSARTRSSHGLSSPRSVMFFRRTLHIPRAPECRPNSTSRFHYLNDLPPDLTASALKGYPSYQVLCTD
ncbi:hypothetical protein J6590_002973 [Homalodisca vitripennis]|nr:hypothetical protein J6590_002973 [Homalodisca vitripennis]